MKYRKNEPIPEGYRVVERPRTALAIAGGVTFGSLYLLTLGLGVAFTEQGDIPAALFIPVVGPFIQGAHLLGQNRSDPVAGIGGAFCLVDGIIQAGGIGMLIGGLASRSKVLLRNDIPDASVRVTPVVAGTRGGGLVVTGTF